MTTVWKPDDSIPEMSEPRRILSQEEQEKLLGWCEVQHRRFKGPLIEERRERVEQRAGE